MPVKLKIEHQKTFDAFLKGGYFPEVLPPIFTSSPFAQHCATANLEISSGAIKALDRISYSCTKRGYARRVFDITHPVSAAFCAAWMSRQWDPIRNFCNQPQTTTAPLSLSEDISHRAVKTASFDAVQRAAKNKTARARYIVKADIAKFYPSIYTHSIPWAIHGKAKAKEIPNPHDEVVYGNQLDWAIRIGQAGQTKGIPIGTDISRVVAEIIGAAVDHIVKDKCGDRIVGYIRNIDDFHIGCKNLSDAESILSALTYALREYELTLNDEKTQIIEAHDFYDDDWAVELDNFISSGASDRKKVISRAFDRTFLYASKNRADSSLKFLIRMIDREIAAQLLSFKDVECDLIRAFVNFPHCIDYVMMMLMAQSARGETYDSEQWSIAINDEIARHSNNSHDHEICWLLCTAYVCGFKISATAALANITNPLNACLIYLLFEKGLIAADLNEIHLQRINGRQTSSNWILVHEGINRGWFKQGEISYEYRKGIEAFLPDKMTFLQDDIVDEFAKTDAENPSIPDRYLRYDEPSDAGYIEYLIKRRLERDEPQRQ